MAASKTIPVERVREAVDAGFGISAKTGSRKRFPKSTPWGARSDLAFYRDVATTKAKSVVGRFDIIHSVDSLALAEEIDRQAKAAGLRQRVLLEVNLGGELSKGDLRRRPWAAVLPALNDLEHLEVRGLMAIPPPPGCGGCPSLLSATARTGSGIDRTGVPEH